MSEEQPNHPLHGVFIELARDLSGDDEAVLERLRAFLAAQGKALLSVDVEVNEVCAPRHIGCRPCRSGGSASTVNCTNEPGWREGCRA